MSSFELLHKRKVCTKLNIFPVIGDSELRLNVRVTVIKRQRRSKEYTNQKRGANIPTLKPGDHVQVKKHMHVSTGTSKCNDPLLIQEKIGPSTFVLGD